MWVLGLAILITLIIWKFAIAGFALRYRLTLTAEVDGRPIAASSVTEVVYYPVWDFLRDDPMNREVAHQVHGQALILDLGARGYLFATLAPVERKPSDGPIFWPWDVFAQAIVTRAWGEPPIQTWRDFYRLFLLPREVLLPLDKLPFLIRFHDLSNPETVEAVDPNAVATSFGSGVRLVEAKVEVTNAPVTTGIEKLLPWIRNAHLDLRLVPSQRNSGTRVGIEKLFFADLRSNWQ